MRSNEHQRPPRKGAIAVRRPRGGGGCGRRGAARCLAKRPRLTCSRVQRQAGRVARGAVAVGGGRAQHTRHLAPPMKTASFSWEVQVCSCKSMSARSTALPPASAPCPRPRRAKGRLASMRATFTAARSFYGTFCWPASQSSTAALLAPSWARIFQRSCAHASRGWLHTCGAAQSEARG